MSVHSHESAGKSRSAACAIITLSDTRTLDNDSSGDAIVRLLDVSGHRVVARVLIRDEPAELKTRLDEFLNRADIDAIITTGGTGIAPRDRTIDVVESLFEIKLPGFGELFRMLSYEQIGAAAMLSRATAGILKNKAIFALPGSTKAVELGMEKIIAPELGHVLMLLRES